MISTFKIITPCQLSSISPFPAPLSLYEGALLPTHLLLPHCSSIPLFWGVKRPRTKGFLSL